MRRASAFLIAGALGISACSGGGAESTTTRPPPATSTTASPATIASTTTTSTSTSTTTTTTTLAFPPTTTTTTIPADEGLGIQLVGEEAYREAVPLYLYERVGDQSVSGRTQNNVVIGVATLVPDQVEIRAPVAGLLTTFEFYEDDPGFASLTRKQALLQTEIFNGLGDRLILRWGTTYDAFHFTHGPYVIDRRVEAGEVIGHAVNNDQAVLDWPRLPPGSDLSVFDRRFNLFFWGEWGSRDTAGEAVIEWFPHLMAHVATNGQISGRLYSTVSDHTISVANAVSPVWGLRPAVLWLPDSGDDPETAAGILEGAEPAVAFSATWSGFDPATGEGFDTALTEVACMLRFVSSEGERYGADARRLTVAGHGAGGVMATLAAAVPDVFAATPEGACQHWDDPAVPMGSVAVGGTFLRGADLEALPPAYAGIYEPEPVGRAGTRRLGFVLSDLDEEADPYAITGVADSMAEAGHETSVMRADATHDQLLNATHGSQGWPTVREIVSVAKWEPIAARFWTAIGDGAPEAAEAELVGVAVDWQRNLVRFMAAFELDFASFGLPVDEGGLHAYRTGNRRCTGGNGNVVCRYRVSSEGVLAALLQAGFDSYPESEVTVGIGDAIHSFTVPRHIEEIAEVMAGFAAETDPDGFAAACGENAYDPDATALVGEVPATETCGELLSGLVSDYLGG